MYCVLDTDGKKIIAIHEDREVVETYRDLIERYHDVKLPIGRVKRKKIKRHPEYDDLYLVRCNETYVQAGYIDVMSIMSESSIHDYRYAKEILLRVLEVDEIDNSEKKALKKSVMVLDRLLRDDEEFVPMLSTLQSAKCDYEAYMYNSGISF